MKKTYIQLNAFNVSVGASSLSKEVNHPKLILVPGTLLNSYQYLHKYYDPVLKAFIEIPENIEAAMRAAQEEQDNIINGEVVVNGN